MYAHPICNKLLCESGFSTLLSNKTKSKKRLNALADIQITISNEMSCFDKVLCNIQTGTKESLSFRWVKNRILNVFKIILHI